MLCYVKEYDIIQKVVSRFWSLENCEAAGLTPWAMADEAE